MALHRISIIVPEAIHAAAQQMALALEGFTLGQGAAVLAPDGGHWRHHDFLAAPGVCDILDGTAPAPSPEAAALIAQMHVARDPAPVGKVPFGLQHRAALGFTADVAAIEAQGEAPPG